MPQIWKWKEVIQNEKTNARSELLGQLDQCKVTIKFIEETKMHNKI